VLFQKVAKELTASVHTPGVQARLAAGQRAAPAPPAALASLDALLELFVAREGRLLGSLLGAMKAARSGEQVWSALHVVIDRDVPSRAGLCLAAGA
jgi:hypothetical protein